MESAVALHGPSTSYATTSTISDTYDVFDAASENQPVAVAVQPRRQLQNQVQLLESQARLTSIRSSILSAVPSTISQEPGPTLPTSPASQQLFPELHSKPSSVLLREENGETTNLGASSQSKTLRGQESSSTLHSFYEPQKLPLVVSQQTSNSSSRDFALRKDCPVVVPPEKQRKHFFETSKSRAKTNERRHRKDPIDLSTLFPKPGSGSRSEVQRIENPPYYKMHVKRPKAGTKHWFDSYNDGSSSDEEGIATAENFEPAMRPELADGLGDAFVNLSSDSSLLSDQLSQQLTPPGSIPRTPEMSKSSRILGIEAPVQSRRTHVQSSYVQRAPSIPTPRATPKVVPINPLDTADLSEQSVLFLSSDDEDEAPALPVVAASYCAVTKPSTTSRLGPRMSVALRESLVVGTLDDIDVEIGQAQRVRSQPAVLTRKAPLVGVPKPSSDPGRSATMKVVVPNRRSSKMGAFLAEPSPQMHEPEMLPSSIPINESRTVNTIVPDGDFGNPQSSLTSLYLEEEDAVSTEPSFQRPTSTCLMPVTRQEQALLTAMRSKKATMRRRSVHQQDSEPWPNETERDSFYQRRPRTSVDTNAPAFVELGSNTYADWMERRGSSIKPSQYSGAQASVTTFATTSQSASTRLSPYLSERGADTPNSAGDSALQRASTGYGMHFSLSSSDTYSRSRSRTNSSHIVVLDDLIDSPIDRESTPLRPSWDYNRWNEGAGIAGLH